MDEAPKRKPSPDSDPGPDPDPGHIPPEEQEDDEETEDERPESDEPRASKSEALLKQQRRKQAEDLMSKMANSSYPGDLWEDIALMRKHEKNAAVRFVQYFEALAQRGAVKLQNSYAHMGFVEREELAQVGICHAVQIVLKGDLSKVEDLEAYLAKIIARKMQRQAQRISLTNISTYREAVSEDTDIDDLDSGLNQIPDKKANTPDRAENRELLVKFQKFLNERGRIVLSLRFGFFCEPQTWSEIGEKLNLSRQRAQQIFNAAMAKLTHGYNPNHEQPDAENPESSSDS